MTHDDVLEAVRMLERATVPQLAGRLRREEPEVQAVLDALSLQGKVRTLTASDARAGGTAGGYIGRTMYLLAEQ